MWARPLDMSSTNVLSAVPKYEEQESPTDIIWRCRSKVLLAGDKISFVLVKPRPKNPAWAQRQWDKAN